MVPINKVFARWPLRGLFAALFVVFFGISLGAEEGSRLFPEPRRLALVGLVRDSAEAGKRYAELLKIADAALSSFPNPIAKIQTEGKLDKDPVKIATSASLGDLAKVRALAWAGFLSGDRRYAAKTRVFLLAWATTNRATGDPIDETNLEAFFLAFDLIAPTLTPDERSVIARWFESVARAEMASRKSKGATGFNNWNSHRLKIVGLAGFVLGEDEFVDYADRGLKEQIEADLLPDGSSFDFVERDALHYHCYTLEPLLGLAAAARLAGRDWFDYVAPSGSSIAKSVAFLLPFAKGERTHAEYVNSKVQFDRDRAAAGQKSFRIGRLFEPREASGVLEGMLFFDASALPLLQKLLGTDSSFPTWNAVVASVARGD